MRLQTQWFIIENEKDYKIALERFDEIIDAKKGTPII